MSADPNTSPLGFDRRGCGEPLVLVHGLGASRHVWDPVIDLLAAERDVIAVDLPGFGRSRPLPAAIEPSPAALARAVIDTVQRLGVGLPHVGGNSLGGWVALEMARAGGARTVTAIAPAGLWGGPLRPRGRVSAHSVGRVLRPLIGPAMAIPAVRRAAMAGTVGHPERLTAREARRLALDYVSAPGFDDVNRAMRSSHFVGGDEIDVPVTLVWCALDRLVRPPRELAVRAREVVLPDCGHTPMTDDPAAVAAVLLAGSAMPSSSPGSAAPWGRARA
jgi:pimeloyl-ACP methyl ester carboxylesterase